MEPVGTYTVDQSWRVLLADLGVSAANLLRRAGLPGDLLARGRATLTQAEYFRAWRALEEEAADPALPLRIGAAIRGEPFADVLARTRTELAHHYLGSTALSAAEISFLLGFEDPNSFYRAFQAWTGTTPEQARGGRRGARARA